MEINGITWEEGSYSGEYHAQGDEELTLYKSERTWEARMYLMGEDLWFPGSTPEAALEGVRAMVSQLRDRCSRILALVPPKEVSNVD